MRAPLNRSRERLSVSGVRSVGAPAAQPLECPLGRVWGPPLGGGPSADRKESVHTSLRPSNAEPRDGADLSRRPPTPIAAHLANGLRGLMGKSQALCRLKRTSPAVQLMEVHCRETGENRLALNGVATCKSVLCPLCAPVIMRRRTEEITHAIDVHGAARTWFATYTVRHNKRMPLALLQRLLTNAYGLMFAGRAGQALSRELGGPTVRSAPPAGLPGAQYGEPRALKPWSIRAHDRTASVRHSWHPHLHALLFLHADLEESRVRELLSRRWRICASRALRAIKNIVHAAVCTGLRREDVNYLEETPELRSRCEKLLGKRIFRPGRSLADAARPLAKALRAFSVSAIVPVDAYGVVVERVREPGRVSQYLSKLGCELSGMWTKNGRIVMEGGSEVEHFGLWQLANVACAHGHPLRQWARGMWTELFYATFGSQTLTWSQGARAHFGLDDLRDEEIDTEGPEVTEDQHLIGQIDGIDWSELARAQRHGLIATLHNAHRLGVLHELPYVKREGFAAGAFMDAPRERRRRARLSDEEREARISSNLNRSARVTLGPDPGPVKEGFGEYRRRYMDGLWKLWRPPSTAPPPRGDPPDG